MGEGVRRMMGSFSYWGIRVIGLSDLLRDFENRDTFLFLNVGK